LLSLENKPKHWNLLLHTLSVKTIKIECYRIPRVIGLKLETA